MSMRDSEAKSLNGKLVDVGFRPMCVISDSPSKDVYRTLEYKLAELGLDDLYVDPVFVPSSEALSGSGVKLEQEGLILYARKNEESSLYEQNSTRIVMPAILTEDGSDYVQAPLHTIR
jgi:hypothetical protein